jgi:non-ribosomal peptide synthetase component F
MMIHELFETQVEQTPDAVAVVFKENRLTYRELDRLADGLAAQLRAMGVGPDVLVALFLERSLEMVVGMMGVLKAGGAYVPLDPIHPGKRLAYMVADAQPAVLVTHERLRSRLPPHRSRVLTIDAGAPPAAEPTQASAPERAHSASDSHMSSTRRVQPASLKGSKSSIVRSSICLNRCSAARGSMPATRCSP